jgi:hypothetical protein
MDSLIGYLQEPAVQIIGWVLGVLGWIFGIVSGWIQVKGYREQKQMEGAYRTLLEQARRDWKGRYTEEQIEELTEQFKLLERQIRREIPRQARMVFLKDHLDTLANSVTEQYREYVRLKKELDDTSELDDLAPSLRTSIEKEIEPRSQRQQHLQYLMSTLIIALIILSLFPSIVELANMTLLGAVKGVGISGRDLYSYMGGILVAMFLAITLPRSRQKRFVTVSKWTLVAVSAFLLIFWPVSLFALIFSPIPLARQWEIIGAILSLIPLFAGVRILCSLRNSLAQDSP